MDDLASLQRRFFALVTAREEITGALARHGLDEAAAAALIHGDERLGPVGRLGIYNDMYFFRLLGVLEDDFPLLARALGTDDFRALIAEYLEAFVPPHALRNLGAGLHSFLTSHPLAQNRPWLRDLAALEWAKADVLDRADATPVTFDDLRALPPDALAAFPLVPVPAATTVVLAHDIDPLVAALEDEDSVIPTPPATAGRVLVWRVGAGAQHRAVGPIEASALERLFAAPPATFAEICDRVDQAQESQDAQETQDQSVEAGAQQAVGLLASWVQTGLIRRP
ncbi:MAG TPA: putative DNA-binding domain-containing protein [Polyangia bacterium]